MVLDYEMVLTDLNDLLVPVGDSLIDRLVACFLVVWACCRLEYTSDQVTQMIYSGLLKTLDPSSRFQTA